MFGVVCIWTVAEIQWAFSILIALETWLTPAGGRLVDALGPRRGPELTVALGAVVSGVGAGFAHATCVGDAVKGSRTGAAWQSG